MLTLTAHKKRGFTLIELLVVVAIIGVLAAVVLIAINPARRLRQARDSGRKSDVSQLATALQAYYTTNSNYPAGLTALTVTQDLKSLPLQPNGTAYSYSLNSTTTEASVWASLEAPTTDTTNTYNWCWQTSSGRARELSTGVACAP